MFIKKQVNSKSTVETLDIGLLAHFGCSAVDKTLISKIFLMYRKLKLTIKKYIEYSG